MSPGAAAAGLDPELGARLALAPLAPPTEARGEAGGEGRSRLLVDGEDTGTRLDGLELEAARRTDFGALVLLTYGCPHEELLEVYLLDGRWRVLERVRLGAPLVAGLVEGLHAPDANTLAFSFFGDDDAWTLTAHPPRWRLHPLACTSLLPVWRPPSQLVARSRLTLAGSYLDGGRRVTVRS